MSIGLSLGRSFHPPIHRSFRPSELTSQSMRRLERKPPKDKEANESQINVPAQRKMLLTIWERWQSCRKVRYGNDGSKLSLLWWRLIKSSLQTRPKRHQPCFTSHWRKIDPSMINSKWLKHFSWLQKRSMERRRLTGYLGIPRVRGYFARNDCNQCATRGILHVMAATNEWRDILHAMTGTNAQHGILYAMTLNHTRRVVFYAQWL